MFRVSGCRRGVERVQEGERRTRSGRGRRRAGLHNILLPARLSFLLLIKCISTQ